MKKCSWLYVYFRLELSSVRSKVTTVSGLFGYNRYTLNRNLCDITVLNEDQVKKNSRFFSKNMATTFFVFSCTHRPKIRDLITTDPTAQKSRQTESGWGRYALRKFRRVCRRRATARRKLRRKIGAAARGWRRARGIFIISLSFNETVRFIMGYVNRLNRINRTGPVWWHIFFWKKNIWAVAQNGVH